MTRSAIALCGPALCSLLILPGCGDGGEPAGPDTDGRGEAAQLAFTVQPGETELHLAIVPAVEVTVQDSAGNPVPMDTSDVTVSLGSNPVGALLEGTTSVRAENGVARFDDLRLDRRAGGYTLVASASGLDGAESDRFDIVLRFSALTVGARHSCAVTESGVGYCWGANTGGQIGDDTDGTDRFAPVRIESDLRWSTLHGGEGHTCGLVRGDGAHCWGDDFYGQLGDGDTGTDRSLPSPVDGDLGFVALAAGDRHTCGLLGDGTSYCWGWNSEGQLGDGNGGTDRGTPVGVADPGIAFTRLDAGNRHTCGLSPGGRGYCWGRNAEGQLGTGTTTAEDEPAPVDTSLTFTAVTAGGSHTCALEIDGRAQCWGWNDAGQLGDGNLDTNSSLPVSVLGGLSFESLTGGSFHTCGVTEDGQGHCWGSNGFGQLGSETQAAERDTPAPIEGDLSFRLLSGGTSHTCGLTTNSDLYCWGSNGRGQLGTGDTLLFQSFVPVRVADPR